MAGYSRHASYVAADRGKDSSGPRAKAEPLVARSAVREFSRVDHDTNSLRLPSFEVEFDFIDHRLIVETSDGAIRETALRPQAVADFYREYMGTLASLGIVVKLWPVPVEVDNPIPFLDDRLHAAYDTAHAHRFFRMLLQADRVTKRFQGRFLGKTSPVHFFWGAFDLALTRFSGRRAHEPKDSEWWVLRESSSHEEISVGFWPGSGTVAEPAFYAYTRPEPPGLASTSIRPATAYSSREPADFILPYEAVRSASSPDEAVLDFYQSAYNAGADLARWDRAAFDRPPGEWSSDVSADALDSSQAECSRPPSRRRSTEAEQKMTHPIPRMVFARCELSLSAP